jgi:glutamate-5-semialdehyde dehydrogenase
MSKLWANRREILMDELLNKCTMAKDAAQKMITVSTVVKDNALKAIADALVDNADEIIAANKEDVENAVKNGIRKAMIDRLTLTKDRICAMADGVREVAALNDPIGEVINMTKRPNGLVIGKKRVPMGVIGIIYEARPNVTADAAALCLKTSNACILRGGSEAIKSNTAIMRIMQGAAYSAGIPEGMLNVIEDTSRETATRLMKMNGYIDMLIPRGGQGLIRSVVENATVPVVETAAGNCHIYIDSECDEDMAIKVLLNAKVSRPSVCNAAETLLIDKKITEKLLPQIVEELTKNNVEIRGCEECRRICENILPATEDDWSTEYNDYIISVKCVGGIDEAIKHINKYNTKHSEAIITNNQNKAERFLNEVDAAAVYVNASTRFTDGFEFGFGAEIGISTQKMHARGPMGLEQLTSVKYIIHGDGQIR